MSLISFNNVSKFYGSDFILDHVSFNINQGEKVALIGNNGTGKTTIFKLILKEIEPSLLPKEDKPGEISILSSLRIGYLNQNAIEDIEHTVKEELLIPFKKVIELEKEIKNFKNVESNIEKYNELLEAFEKNKGYSYQNEIDNLVTKFSFPLSILDKKIKEMSGGERMKIAFIKILLFDYDLLLLDEPTNHLDISTIEWLEDFLSTYKGTIFFVSHDPYFIAKLANKIIELENKKVTVYNSTYEQYKELKREKYEYLLKQSKKEQILIEKYKRFIEFYKPKPRFVSRAKDREKKLAKLEKNLTEVPQNEKKQIKFNIAGGNLSTRQLLEFNDVSVGYDKPLVKNFSFILYGQDRLAIVGNNGIGKTTLIKTIIKEIKPIEGKIRELRTIKYGYIKQNDFIFSKDITAIDFLKQNYPNKLEKELRNVLGHFQFDEDLVYRNVLSMSNGEKVRLIIASLSLSDYDILLLDEPTNHLDMLSKESLINALKNYKGCIIFISHDRYFINNLATEVLYFDTNQSLFIDGNYDDLVKVLERQKNTPKVTIKEIEESIKQNFPTKNKLSNNKINELQKELKEIEDKMESLDEKINDDFTSYTEYDDLVEEKEKLEERYLEIIELLS